MGIPSISELATIICDNTKVVNEYLDSQAPLSADGDFKNVALASVPSSAIEIQAAKARVIVATEQLNRLMKGPAQTLGLGFLSLLADLLEIHFTQRFGIANLVPSDGTSVSYHELAAKTGLAVNDIERILKRAILNGLFEETEEGQITHTALSKTLAETPPLADVVDLFAEEAWPSFSKVVEALDRFQGQRHLPEQSGFSVANHTSKGMYAYLADNPQRMARFARAMAGFAAIEEPQPVIDAIDWGNVTTVVDVGGAFGPYSIALAKAYPHLRCVVQDFSDVVSQGEAKLPRELRGQVRFEPHDMFQPQISNNADVYLFCSIFHNWSDVKCVEILRAHIPALKTGSQLVILDWGLATAETTSPVVEKTRRTMDLTMLAFFGGKERSSQDWKALVAEASPKFKLVSAQSPSPIVHIIWQG